MILIGDVAENHFQNFGKGMILSDCFMIFMTSLQRAQTIFRPLSFILAYFAYIFIVTHRFLIYLILKKYKLKWTFSSPLSLELLAHLSLMRGD